MLSTKIIAIEDNSQLLTERLKKQEQYFFRTITIK